MKNLSKISFTLLVAAVMFLTSCAAIMGIDLTKLSLGMDKETAYKTLRAKPTEVIVAKQYPSGSLEVVQFTTPHADGTRPDKSWLYFFNDKLVEFGKPGDWEAEADHILRMQQRR